MRTLRIKAVFKGANNSCGYKRDREYILLVSHGIDEYISIEKADSGTKHCDYDTIIGFLNNWDNIRKL